MRGTSTRLLLVAAGITIGIAISLVMQPSKTTAQGIHNIGNYQILGTPSANAVVWRINTVTGGLELCFAANYSALMATADIPRGARLVLDGRCSMMPPPAN